MNPSEWRDVITAGSVAITAVTVAIGSWRALKEYRLKLEAETRAAKKDEAETDVRLLKAFTDLGARACGRGGYVVSEKAIEELFKQFSKEDFGDLKSLKERISEFPVIYLPVGLAEQDAAIAALATLGIRHKDVLGDVAIQALESAMGFRKEIAEKHLARMTNAKAP